MSDTERDAGEAAAKDADETLPPGNRYPEGAANLRRRLKEVRQEAFGPEALAQAQAEADAAWEAGRADASDTSSMPDGPTER